MPQSVRVRISLWFAAALTAILVLYSGGIYVWLEHNLISSVDSQLREDYEAAEEGLRLLDEGKVSWSGSYEHGDDGAGKEIPKWIDVWDNKGEGLYSNRPGSIQSNLSAGACLNQRYHSETLDVPGLGAIRTFCGQHTIGTLPAIIRVARSLETVHRELAALMLIIALALPVAIGISGLGGYFLARRLLAPIGKMVNRAKTITADKLTERLPVENPDDELGHLAGTFNEAFARLERSFEQMKRFSSDASHELRTPLTALRSVGEVYLRQKQHNNCFETVASMLEESDRMQQLIDSLLTLSRADAGQIRKNARAENLEDLAKDVVKHLGVLAEEKNQKLNVSSRGSVFASVDSTLLRQAVINLVDNAIKYSPQDSMIEVRVERRNGKAVLEVEDHGPGIPTDEQSRIFDRFYRVDQSRARDLGGFGLGLSIAKWAVEINDGNLELESPEGSGSIFRITLQAQETVFQ